MKMNHAFDAILISAERGARKPDPAIFRLAAQELGVEPSSGWHVGDHPVNDIEGSRRAGLQPVWFSGVHPWPKELARPAYTVTGLHQLISIIFP
jgi:putative hydrolase of the HAD superfamily